MQRGELYIEHYDRAILDCLAADFLPFSSGATGGPNSVEGGSTESGGLGFGIGGDGGGYDAGDDADCAAEIPRRQVQVDGVTGTGLDGRVVVVWDFPDDAFNNEILPGIRVNRTDISDDEQRMMAHGVGHKYRIPADGASEVSVETPSGTRYGWTSYVEREHAQHYIFSYEIEVRAAFPFEALALRRYVARKFKDRSFLFVKDSLDEPSAFTLFRDPPIDVKEYIDSLDRYFGFITPIRVQADLDDYEEEEKRALVSAPTMRLHEHEG